VLIGGHPFFISAGATAVTFFAIGAIKGRLVGQAQVRHGLETLLVGGGAAVLAYLVGLLARGLL